MRGPFSDDPGYNQGVGDVFGSQVDFSIWDKVCAAGRGPTERERFGAIAGLRAMTSAMADVSIQRLPQSTGQTVMREQYTSNTGFFMPGS